MFLNIFQNIFSGDRFYRQKSPSVEIFASVIEPEGSRKRAELLIVYAVLDTESRREHIELCRLLHRLDKTERLVKRPARAVDAVSRPYAEALLLQLLGGGDTDIVGAADHPGKHGNSLGEDDDALGLHLPERSGEVTLGK